MHDETGFPYKLELEERLNSIKRRVNNQPKI